MRCLIILLALTLLALASLVPDRGDGLEKRQVSLAIDFRMFAIRL